MRVLLISLLILFNQTVIAQDITVVDSPNISEEQLDALRDVKVFPNPSHDHFSMINPKIGEESQLLIVDVAGRLMYMQLIKPDIRTIEVQHHLDPGTYVVILKDRNGSKIGKLMVE